MLLLNFVFNLLENDIDSSLICFFANCSFCFLFLMHASVCLYVCAFRLTE